MTRSYVLPRSLPSALHDASLRWRVRVVELEVPVPPVSQQLPLIFWHRAREPVDLPYCPNSSDVATSERESWPSPATAASRLSDALTTRGMHMMTPSYLLLKSNPTEDGTQPSATCAATRRLVSCCRVVGYEGRYPLFAGFCTSRAVVSSLLDADDSLGSQCRPRRCRDRQSSASRNDYLTLRKCYLPTLLGSTDNRTRQHLRPCHPVCRADDRRLGAYSSSGT